MDQVPQREIVAGSYVSLVMHAVRGLEPSHKLTLAVLADCANIKDHGVTFPAVHTLCDRVGIVDRRTMQRILRELEATGWLLVEQASKGGHGRTTRYRLNLPKLRGSGHGNGGTQPADNGGTQPTDNSGTQPTLPRGTQPADNRGAQPALPPQPVDNSTNRGLHTAGANPGTRVSTAGQEGQNRGPQPARSFEPEVILNRKGEGAPAHIGDFLRNALNGNRNPFEKKLDQPQPENPEGPPLATTSTQPTGPPPPLRPIPRSQAEQLAFIERALHAKTKDDP